MKCFFRAITDGNLPLVQKIINENGGKDFLARNVDDFVVTASFGSQDSGTTDFVKGKYAGDYISAPCGVLGVLSAIYANKPEISDYLFSLGVPPDTRIPDESQSPLIYKAIEYQCLEIVEQILSRGVSANTVNGKGISCLYAAVPGLSVPYETGEKLARRIKIIEALGRHGVDTLFEGKDISPAFRAVNWTKGIIFLLPPHITGDISASDLTVDPKSPVFEVMDALKRIGVDPNRPCVSFINMEHAFNFGVHLHKKVAAKDFNDSRTILGKACRVFNWCTGNSMGR